MTTGEKIRAARKEKGLTQKELGELCGIAEPTIRRYELGNLNPKSATLKKIAAPLGINYLDLYDDNEKEEIASFIQSGIKLGLNAQVAFHNLDTLEPYRKQGYEFTSSEAKIVSAFNKLTSEGQWLAIITVESLAKNKQFRLMTQEGEESAVDPQEND